MNNMLIIDRLNFIVNEINETLKGSYLNRIECLDEYDYIFRFSESETGYHEQDFVPLARKPHRYLEQNSLGQSYGLSSFIDEDAARHHMLLPQIRKKFKSLIKICTNAEYGVLKHTPSKNNKDHFTWWHTQTFMQKLQAEQIIIKVE